MQAAHSARRGDAKLVAQPDAQILEDPQRLGGIAARGEHLHQGLVGGLAVWLALDDAAGERLDALQRRTAQREADVDGHLDERREQIGEPAPALVKPAPFELCEQRLLDYAQRLLAHPQGVGRAPVVEEAPSVGRRGLRRLDVDPRRLAQVQANRSAGGQPLAAHDRPQPREERVDGGVRVTRSSLGPQGLRELVPAHHAIPVQHQVREQQAALPRRKRALHIVSVELHAQLTAQPDTRTR